MPKTDSQMIRLFPHFIVAAKEVDQVAGRKAQRFGRFADARLHRLQHIQHHAHGRPITWVFSAQPQPPGPVCAGP